MLLLDQFDPEERGLAQLRHIKLRVCALAVIFALGVLASGLILIYGIALSVISTYLLFAVLLLIAVTAITFWVREFKRLKTMKLIIENPIMHIRSAVISNISFEPERTENMESTEITVSYFGILLDSRLIKFNQDGIRLRGVAFGSDYIALSYGTDNRMQSIRLLRPTIDPAGMKEIFERFRYETGITPALLS